MYISKLENLQNNTGNMNYKKQELKDFIQSWNKTHETKIRVIGGFAKKGHSKHDIDIMLSKHLSHDKEAQLAQQLSRITGFSRIDIFNPITKTELRILRRGTQDELGMFGWEALPEQYKPDYLITSYNEKGIPISKGRISKKELQYFDYRVNALAYHDALRRYVYRKINEKYGTSNLPRRVLRIIEKVRMEERRDKELLQKYGISRKKITRVQEEMGLIKKGMYIDTMKLRGDARKKYFKGLKI